MTETQTQPTTYRASFMPIAAKCPAACHDCGQLMIREDAGKVTEGGTCTHKICEIIVRTGHRPEDLSPYIEKWGGEPDHVGRMTWYAEKFWQEMRGAFPEPHCEVELFGTRFGTYPFGLTGHADIVSVVDGEMGKVLDWKAGYRTDVDAEPQMRAYAYMVAQGFEGVKKVQATVVWLADQTYQTWDWTVAELVNWGVKIATAIEEWDGKTYTAGDHCRYCPRFYSCPAQSAMIRTTVRDLASLGESPDEITLARLGEYYPAVQSIKRLLERYGKLTHAAIEAHGPLRVDDEYALKLDTAQRESIDAQKAWPIMAEVLSQDALAECVSVSKVKLLKAAAAGAARGQKGKAKTAIMDELRAAGAVTSKPRTSLRMVKADTIKTDE